MTIKNQSGFTLVEVMMAVVLVAILAGIGVAQYTDFGKETKNASTKQGLGILRDGISKQYGQMRLRCGITGSNWPLLLDVFNNDITFTTGATTTTTGCGTDKVTSPSDRLFFTGSTPENPWSGATAASKNSIVADTAAQAVWGTTNCGNAVYTSADGGWCYSLATGTIRANSGNNGGAGATLEGNF